MAVKLKRWATLVELRRDVSFADSADIPGITDGVDEEDSSSMAAGEVLLVRLLDYVDWRSVSGSNLLFCVECFAIINIVSSDVLRKY